MERDAPSAEEAGLELERWGTRFARPETEASFRAWQLDATATLNLLAVSLAVGTWLLYAGIGFVVRPTGFRPWLLAILCVQLPSLLVTGATLLRPSTRRWHLPVLFVAFVVAGVLAVGSINLHFNLRGEAIAGLCISSYFTFVIFRAPPRYGALGVLPGVLYEVKILFGLRSAAALDRGTMWIDILIVFITYFTGLLMSLRLDVVSRRAFRQERIIEAQRVTIAREHARSASLMKQELSHQVAERSRELGEVLAKADVTLDARRLTPGERLDVRYRVVAELGAGGMGTVYEVERLTDDTRFALKAIVGEVSRAAAARFAREAEIGARVHHENVVSIVDVGVASGAPFLVMELVRGGALESKRARFGDVSWALPIIAQIAKGLAALHDAGVVHRDLKPANVLLEGDDAAPRAKISDFGISRLGAPHEASLTDPNAPTAAATPAKPVALTATGMVMGTPMYMAPEAAIGGRAVDKPADVFALGIIAYELLSGRAPFSVPAVISAMAGQPPPPVTPLEQASAPRELVAVVLACLAADPNERPRVAEILDALD